MKQMLSREPANAELEQLRSTHIGGDIQIEELRRYAKELSERHDDMDGPSFLAHAPSFAKTSVEFLRA